MTFILHWSFRSQQANSSESCLCANGNKFLDGYRCLRLPYLDKINWRSSIIQGVKSARPFPINHKNSFGYLKDVGNSLFNGSSVMRLNYRFFNVSPGSSVKSPVRGETPG